MVLEIPQSPELRSLADGRGQLLLRDALIDIADLQAAQCLRSRQDGTVSNMRAAEPWHKRMQHVEWQLCCSKRASQKDVQKQAACTNSGGFSAHLEEAGAVVRAREGGVL